MNRRLAPRFARTKANSVPTRNRLRPSSSNFSGSTAMSTSTAPSPFDAPPPSHVMRKGAPSSSWKTPSFQERM
ncbi:unnamed protein product [Symbiodinium sp. KB8]|nr:unnamed protein product [Symbiodinium sp. KB8]